MLERIKNNWWAKLIALGLALLLWLYVNIQANPELEDVYSNIPVEVTGLTQNLALIDRPPTVQVRVAGTRTGLAALNQRDIKALVDLSGASPGSNLVPVNVVVPGTVKVVAITPAQINIALDQVIEERWPVVVKMTGTLGDFYTLHEPEAKPDFVFLHGASKVLAEVQEVFVTAALTVEMVADQTLTLPVEVVNRANMPVTLSLRVNPQWVEVLVPVEEKIITKTIPINFTLTGEPAAGFQVLETKVEPAAITAGGPATELAGITAITAGEINIEGVTETFVIERELTLPEEVTALEGEKLIITIVVAEEG